MNKLDHLMSGDPSAWLTSLPIYQRNLVKDLLKATGGSPEQAAEKWLSARPENTFPFGTVPVKKLYFAKLVEEVEAFLCGDPRYEDDRQKLLIESQATHSFAIGVISVAIAPLMGTAAPILAPSIALILMMVSKISISAWCASCKEKRSNNQVASSQLDAKEIGGT